MGVIPSGYDYAFKVAAHEKLLEQWKRGALRAPVYRRFDFEHVPDAIALLAQGSVMGKVVISLGGEAERDQGS